MLSPPQVEAVFKTLARWLPLDQPRPAHIKEDKDLFRALVACLLSAQSRDENTAQAKNALFAMADTPAAILKLSDEQIVAAIKPAGLYNMKARNLRRLCAAVLELADGRIPRDRAGLMRLPGIGRKCADIVLRFSLQQPVIAVDTHIHRLCNRTGLAEGKTEAQTAKSLESRTPGWALQHGHIRLLEFGKQICRSRRPRCEECPLTECCEFYRIKQRNY
ncbi:MAG: endonuclease III [Wenzhouxiangellaceae bacterium]